MSCAAHKRLERLNELSLSHSFTPQIDIDWLQTTTDEEYLALYDAWSLLAGTGKDRDLERSGRIAFAKYQQMNLMLFTGLLERHGIASLSRLYDLDSSQPFAEYVGNFIKEEVYHYTMFTRAVAQIRLSMPERLQPPEWRIDTLMRGMFRFVVWLPGRRLRSHVTFSLFRFAERVTMIADHTARHHIERAESFVRQIWQYHALDEARHLAFDDWVLEQSRLPRPLAWLPAMLIAPMCLLLSLVLNANEIEAARRLGVTVRIWHLPQLMLRTEAPFKRRVFGLLRELTSRSAPAPGDNSTGSAAGRAGDAAP